MAREEFIIIGAVVVAAVAYVGNIGGFKSWADSLSRGGVIGTGGGPSNACDTIKCGSGYEKKKIPGTENRCQCIAKRGEYTKPFDPSEALQCFNSKSKTGAVTTCCNGQPCGGGANKSWCILGPGRFTDAKKAWLLNLGCKGKLAYSYYGALNPTENRLSVA